MRLRQLDIASPVYTRYPLILQLGGLLLQCGTRPLGPHLYSLVDSSSVSKVSCPRKHPTTPKWPHRALTIWLCCLTTHKHTHTTHTHKHTHVHTNTHTQTHTCTHLKQQTICMHACMHAYTIQNIETHIYTPTCLKQCHTYSGMLRAKEPVAKVVTTEGIL